MKLGSLFSSLVTIMLSVIGIGFGSYVNSNYFYSSGLGLVVSNIIYIPLLIILYIVLFGLLLSSLLTTIKGISSISKAIKILSIILLGVVIILIVFYVLIFAQFVNLTGI